MNKTSMTQGSTFPVRIGAVFKDAFAGYFKNLVPLSVAGFTTLAIAYFAAIYPLDPLKDQPNFVRSLAFAAGLVLAGVSAYPWYCYALDAADGIPARIRRPFENPGLFYDQAVSSFWFWAGVGLGLRYLAGIPAFFVVVLYAFHGYVIADRKSDSGLKALGTSVRLGEGYRIVLFALMAMFGMFSLLGALALGIPDEDGDPLVNPLTIGLAVLGLTVTTSITMVAGGRIYRALMDQLDD